MCRDGGGVEGIFTVADVSFADDGVVGIGSLPSESPSWLRPGVTTGAHTEVEASSLERSPTDARSRSTA